MRSENPGHQDRDMIRQMKKSNYYDILEIKQDATEAEIKKSFKQMALKYHPDKNSAVYSKQVFHKISQAYDTLSDASKRDAYDRKQSFQKMPQQDFNFRKTTMFFYQAPSFSNFNQRHYYQHSDYLRKKGAEQRMDDRARHERQKFKKQHNQKYKFSSSNYNNGFFKSDDNSNNKNLFQAPNDKQKPKQNSDYKKQENTFKFQKNTFQQPSNEQQQLDEKRRQRQRKYRLQKQKEIGQKNLKYFFLMVLAITLWIAFDNFGGAMRGVQVYSMNQSGTYKIPKFTKQLNSPFYVTEDYIQRATEDDKFREHVDRKIDIVFIKSLSRNCNTMQTKEAQLNLMLQSVKSAKSKRRIYQQLQSLDFSSCTDLHLIRQRNPTYFKSLFLNTASRYQL